MKKRLIILVGIMLVMAVTFVPVVGNIIYKEQKEQVSAKEKLNAINEKIEDIENATNHSDEGDQEYKKLIEEKAEKEIECGVYDYKEEIELRVNTLETVIADMERDLKRGIIPTDELKKDCKNRIKKLTPVAKKYRKILEKGDKEELNYEQIAKELDYELDKVYEQINY